LTINPFYQRPDCLRLIAAWLVLGMMMRREYVESFRRALRRRQLDLGQLRVRLQDAESVELLLSALDDRPTRLVVLPYFTPSGTPATAVLTPRIVVNVLTLS